MQAEFGLLKKYEISKLYPIFRYFNCMTPLFSPQPKRYFSVALGLKSSFSFPTRLERYSLLPTRPKSHFSYIFFMNEEPSLVPRQPKRFQEPATLHKLANVVSCRSWCGRRAFLFPRGRKVIFCHFDAFWFCHHLSRPFPSHHHLSHAFSSRHHFSRIFPSQCSISRAFSFRSISSCLSSWLAHSIKPLPTCCVCHHTLAISTVMSGDLSCHFTRIMSH